MVEALRHTPLFEEHQKLGARLVPFAGWEMPVQYTGIVDEHTAVRTACGLCDVAHMGRLQLVGEYAGQVVNYLVTSTDVSDDIAYQMTKLIFESRGELANAHAAGKEIRPEHAAEGSPVPLHPGAIRYYREKGLIK